MMAQAGRNMAAILVCSFINFCQKMYCGVLENTRIEHKVVSIKLEQKFNDDV